MSEHVVRPSIPPLCWLAIADFTGVVFAEELTWTAWARAWGGATLVLAVASVVALSLAWATRRRGTLCLVLLGFAVGVASAAAFWLTWQLDASRAAHFGGRPVTVTIVGDPRHGQFGDSTLARLGRTRVDVAWPRGAVPPALGERAVVIGAWTAAPRDDAGRDDHQAGVPLRLRVRVVRRVQSSGGVFGAISAARKRACEEVGQVPGTGGALLGAIVLGDKSRLTGTPADEAWKTCGLAHLIAVSGSHLIVLAAIAAWMCTAIGLRPVPRVFTVAAFTLVYVFFTGVQTSAVRCWVMAVVMTAAVSLGRRADPLAALSATSVLMLLADPTAAFSLGFQLSVVAVGGLALFGRLARGWTAAVLPKKARFLAAPLSATTVAVVGTAPIAASAFGVVPIVAPLANMLFTWPMLVSLLGGMTALAIAPVAPGAGSWLLRLCAALLGATNAAVERVADIPGAATAASGSAGLGLGVVAGGVLLWLAWPQPRRRLARAGISLLVASALVGCAVPSGAGPEVRVLDVGQGDAILVRDGRHAILVDGGPSQVRLRQELSAAHVTHLDAVLATHLHADHSGGFRGLDGVIRVPVAYVPPGCPAAELGRLLPRGARVQALSQGARLRCGTWDITVLWPPPTGHDPNQNDGCIVALVQRGSLRVLLTGDAEDDVTRACVRSGTLGRIDVLKVGHHGSAGAVSPETLKLLRPGVAVISVGAGNRFGHPTAETLGQLQTARVPVFRTDLSGDVRIIPAAGGFRILVQRRPRYNPYTPPAKELHVLRTHTRVPALQLRGPPPGTSPRELPGALRRGGRPRLQHVDVRRRFS